jgi:acetyl esterase
VNIVVDPEMQPILTELKSRAAPDARTVPIAEARAAFEEGNRVWNEPRLPIGAVEDLSIDGEGGPIPLRLYLPDVDGPVPVIVYAHGGGWTFGSLESHDGVCRNLAQACRCAIFAVDYRLVPEHPFPAPNADVLAAIRFVMTGGLGERIDARRVGVGGDSAGANLVLSAMMSMRERGETPVSAGALFYGCYTPQLDGRSQKRLGDGTYLLTTDAQRWYWANFLGDAAGGEVDPLAAPLDADLSRLPPLYLCAAGLDPLLDDTLALCDRLALAGVPYRYDFFPGVTHGFLRMTSRLNAARVAMRQVAHFFRDAFELR